MTCSHRWTRFPIIDFGFDYMCTICHRRDRFAMTEWIASRSLPDIDQLVVDANGGVYVGEFTDLIASELGRKYL